MKLSLKTLVITSAISLLGVFACSEQKEDSRDSEQIVEQQEPEVEADGEGDATDFDSDNQQTAPAKNQDQPLEENSEEATDTGDGSNAVSIVKCVFSIEGETFEGNSAEECKKLRADLGLPEIERPKNPGTGNSSYQCKFSVDGKTFEGTSKEACDALKETLGLGKSEPAPGSSSSDVACSFSVGGENFKGSSQEECDQLKNELGLD